MSPQSELSTLILSPLVLPVCMAFILYGILTGQMFDYIANFPNDPRWLKGIAYSLSVLESVHSALLLYSLYHYTIEGSGDADVALRIVWSASLFLVFDGLIVIIVQSYFIWRIWILSMKNRMLISLLGVMALAHLCLEIVTMSWELSSHTPTWLAFHSNHKALICFVSFLSFGAGVDVLVTITLCFYLRRMRTGFRRTETAIRLATAYTVNTGAITSIAALATLITFLHPSNDTISAGLLALSSKLYTITFFGSLNTSRQKPPNTVVIQDSSTLQWPGSPGETSRSAAPIQIFRLQEVDNSSLSEHLRSPTSGGGAASGVEHRHANFSHKDSCTDKDSA